MMSSPVTLITGASSGLGRLFARACAARGDRLALVARRKNALNELARELDNNSIVIAEDLSDYDAVDAIIAELEAQDCHVATLINNAGFGAHGEFKDLPLGDQIDMIQVNNSALMQLCHAVIPTMISLGQGAILNVASTASFQAGPGMATYYASKAFVLSFTEALHEELEPHNIRVTALCPGATRTQFADVAGMRDSQLFKKFAGEPTAVVAAGLKGLAKNKAIVIPGLVNKAMVQSTRLAPRSVAREIVKQLQR
jgi:short-subunit dehydrogenase